MIISRVLALMFIFLIHVSESFSVPVHEEKEKVSKPTSGLRAVTMVNVSPDDEYTETTHVDYTLLGDSENTARLKNIFEALMPRMQESKSISPNFLITLGALNEEERESEKLGSKSKKAIIALSSLSAVCIGSVEAVLALTEYNLFQTSIIPPSPSSAEEIEEYTFGPYVLWPILGPIAVFSLVKNYGASKEFMEWIFIENSSYRGIALGGRNSNIILGRAL